MALPSDWSAFLAAIRAQETGGNYTQDSAGCLGAYCWSTQAGWASMATQAGQGHYASMNPSQVPASVQDKVASANLYRIYQQSGGGTGGLSAAARWWNGGTTSSVPNPGLPAAPWAKSCGGGSSGAYACQVLTRMGLGGHYLANTGSGAGGTVLTAASGSTSTCLIGFPGVPGTGGLGAMIGEAISGNIGGALAGGPAQPNAGGFCLLSKSQARAVLAVGSLVAGGVILGVGLALTVTLSVPRQVLAVAMPAARAFAGGGAAGPRHTAPGQNLSQGEIRQAQANRRALDKAKKADDKAAAGE